MTGPPLILDLSRPVSRVLRPTRSMASAWSDTILDYSSDSPGRVTQCARMAAWQQPDWPSHIATVLRIAGEVAV